MHVGQNSSNTNNITGQTNILTETNRPHWNISLWNLSTLVIISSTNTASSLSVFFFFFSISLSALLIKVLVLFVFSPHLSGHYVGDFQKEKSAQLFILCDRPHDAKLILIGFRGTEPFDAYDWNTDFDYSWYEIPNVGKVHIGFLEAVGLGNRNDAATFRYHLQMGGTDFEHSNGANFASSWPVTVGSSYSEATIRGGDDIPPEMVNMIAYYAARMKLRSLLKEHKDAKFVVTGHSSGGALAVLFPTVPVIQQEMDVTQRLLCVYTFGQPRVGNMQQGKYMETRLEYPVPKYFRVVYCNDLVPRLPYDKKNVPAQAFWSVPLL